MVRIGSCPEVKADVEVNFCSATVKLGVPPTPLMFKPKD